MILKPSSDKQNSPSSSVTAAYRVRSKKTTSRVKSITCESASPTAKLSKTLEAGSTSVEKAYVPFWNEQCQEISSKLYLPTETEFAALDSISSDGLLKKAGENSWFSINLACHPSKSLLAISSRSCMCSPAACTVSEVTKTKLLRISPTKEQRQTFKQWTDCSRYVFNQTISYIRSCVNFTPSWMDIKKDLLKQLPQWCKEVPFQIKGIAVKEACNAFWAAKGNPSFRRLKDPEQSCFIPKSAIKSEGVYYRISGSGLKYLEQCPSEPMDSRLIWRFGKWWLAVPHKEHFTKPENQGRVVALDPGVRTFITFYSAGMSGMIGQGDFSRIQRLCSHLDRLISKRDTCFNKQRRRSLTLASRRMHAKIRHLISELHHKASKFLTDNFDVILLPTFETKDMACKTRRKIRKKSVRSMLTFSHYKFKQFLKWKCEQTGKTVLDVDESYTSKTHPQTGKIRNIGSAKRIRLLDGSWVNRDIVGAFNILLKALTDSSTQLSAVDVC